jgi:CHAD domain-containing protein
MPERSKTRVGPSKFELQLDPGLSTGQAIKQIHLVLLQSMCSNEEGIRTNLDPEFLHDFRVTIRRTRAALTQIKYIYPDDITVHIRGELAWLGQKTGPLRDLDVFLLRIEYFKTHLPKSMQQVLDPFYQFLHANQQVEHRRLLHTLESARYRLRIECKKLRYFLKFFHSLYKPSEMKRPTRALKRLQDDLGDFNDYEVQQDKLKFFGADMKQQRLVPVETLMAISHLVDTLRHGQARERVRFQKCFAEFSKLENRKRFRRLFKK